jgi:chromosome segregation ATPase
MKSVWIAGLAVAVSGSALAQTMIYKHVDESGRVTYSNKPMKGATVMELEPITIFPTPPAVVAAAKSSATVALEKSNAALEKAALALEKESKAGSSPRPSVATLTPVAALASIDTQTQRKRDNERRRILEVELKQEEGSLAALRDSITQEQLNPALVAAVRAAQQTADPTPTQLAEFRVNIDKVSGRIRGLQSTAAEHEKNIEALKKELGALKP